MSLFHPVFLFHLLFCFSLSLHIIICLSPSVSSFHSLSLVLYFMLFSSVPFSFHLVRACLEFLPPVHSLASSPGSFSAIPSSLKLKYFPVRHDVVDLLCHVAFRVWVGVRTLHGHVHGLQAAGRSLLITFVSLTCRAKARLICPDTVPQ